MVYPSRFGMTPPAVVPSPRWTAAPYSFYGPNPNDAFGSPIDPPPVYRPAGQIPPPPQPPGPPPPAYGGYQAWVFFFLLLLLIAGGYYLYSRRLIFR
ncbi:MAG TPA: hypothetical protein VFK44_06190 [Bacillales bacterium]|nr:hypothetical protein [Bacillales bacterium]